MIALAALSVVGVPFLTQMGLAAAGTVAVAVVIALTLLPALLGLVGRRQHGCAGHHPTQGVEKPRHRLDEAADSVPAARQRVPA